MKQYAKEIIVVWESPENDEPYMMVHQNIEEAAVLGEKVKAGIYKLEKTVEITTDVHSS